MYKAYPHFEYQICCISYHVILMTSEGNRWCFGVSGAACLYHQAKLKLEAKSPSDDNRWVDSD